MARLGARAILERGHRVGRSSCRVIPALEGGGAEGDGRAGDRVLPGAPAQFKQRAVQFALGWRRGEQRADYGEAQPRPAIAVFRIV